MSTILSTVTADQLLYSRVEPAYSAQHKGGFQTVYKTPLLTAPEINVIEERVQSFAPLDAAQVRYQFFRLESGSFAITHSCRIESHLEITDAEGRSGAFIAHCLVLTPTELAKVQNNPFALICNFPFINDPVSMVQRFGQASGSAPAVMHSIPTVFPAIDGDWSNIEAGKLVALAEAAPSLRQQQQSIQILGEHGEILATLALAFRLMRRQTRLLCSFDTFAEQATIKPSDYWAVGRSQRQSRFVYTISATQQRVEGQNLPTLPGSDLYLGWLKAALTTQPAPIVRQKATLIQEIAQAFATKTSSLIKEADSALQTEFAALHQETIIANLQTAFAQFVRPELAALLSHYALKYWPLFSNLQMAAQQKLEPGRAASLMRNWIGEAKPQLSDKEWSQLQAFAKQAGNLPLFYLAISLCKKPDRKTQAEILTGINAEDFRSLLPWLSDPIPPAALVTSAHLSLLLSDKRLPQMTNEQLVELIEAIVELGDVHPLDALDVYVERLGYKEVVQIEKILNQQSVQPLKFTSAVKQQREKFGSKQPLWKRFLPNLRRSSK